MVNIYLAGWHPNNLIQVVFFYTVALFYGYVIKEIKSERQRADRGIIWVRELEAKVEERTRELSRLYDALTESETRYRAVSEMMSDFAYAATLGPDGLSFDWVTDSFSRISGYGIEDLAENPQQDSPPGRCGAGRTRWPGAAARRAICFRMSDRDARRRGAPAADAHPAGAGRRRSHPSLRSGPGHHRPSPSRGRTESSARGLGSDARSGRYQRSARAGPVLQLRGARHARGFAASRHHRPTTRRNISRSGRGS